MKKCLICNSEGYPLCPSCRKDLLQGNYYTDLPYIEQVDTIFAYSGQIRSLMLRLKFTRKRSLEAAFCDIMMENYDFSFIDYIGYIPSDYRRFYKRGYNVSRDLAKALSKKVKIPWGVFLGKSRLTKESHRLDVYEKRSIDHAFYAKVEDLSGRLLLIDDVITSGRTISQAAKVLKFKNPDLSIYGLVVLDNKGIV